jgi:hypothetical protein
MSQTSNFEIKLSMIRTVHLWIAMRLKCLYHGFGVCISRKFKVF